MIGVDELVAFLTRCLDEDERIARQMTAEPGGFYLEAETDSVNIMTVGAFVHRWNPKRALAEVKAKRRIIDRYEDALARQQDPDHSQIAAHIQAEEYEDWIIVAFAQPYAGQDGWREEWRTEADVDTA